jgi:hypothetical protein
MRKEKIWVNFQRKKIELFTQKDVIKLSKIWVWDPGSGKNLLLIPDPKSRVKKASDPGSRIQIRNTGYFYWTHGSRANKCKAPCSWLENLSPQGGLTGLPLCF